MEAMHHSKLSYHSVDVLAVLLLHHVSLLGGIDPYLIHHLKLVMLQLLGLRLMGLPREGLMGLGVLYRLPLLMLL